ncbi:MAG: THUMP domain-containing protein, partial [Bacteroidota bacterium]
ADELKAIGAEQIELLNRAVKCNGDNELLYRSNLYLKTAIKVLKPIAYFTIFNEHQLYKEIKSLKWYQYMNTADTLAIEATTSGDKFTHSKYVALKSKDAIVDQFRDRTGRRPSVDTENPDLSINIHIADTKCTVSLDSSGDPLGKRGYRLARNLAPLSENLAQGLVLLSNWDTTKTLVDPMCGSGTIPIEAALLAKNDLKTIKRKFAFQKWRDFDGRLFRTIIKSAEPNRNTEGVKILAFDKDPEAIKISKENARRAGVDDLIE